MEKTIEEMVAQIESNGHRPSYDLLPSRTWALYLMSDGETPDETIIAYQGYSPHGSTITQATRQLLDKSNEQANKPEKVEEESTCTSSI